MTLVYEKKLKRLGLKQNRRKGKIVIVRVKSRPKKRKPQSNMGFNWNAFR